MPHHYTGGDTNRMTLVYFCVSALDLMDQLPSDSYKYVEWIYSLQILPNDDNDGYCGFRGGSYLSRGMHSINVYDTSHLTMTYTALCLLLILGDDLSRVNRPAVISSLKKLQKPNGSFSATAITSEVDMRFLFCACAISNILNDYSGINIDGALEYIQKSQNFDGAFGQGPHQESHGGSTYCAVASLALLNKLDCLKNRDLLIKWLLSRQTLGFHGRINKPDDTCYGFWIGATLSILDAYKFVNIPMLLSFMESTKTRFGGFGKSPDTFPDVMHASLGFSALAISGRHDLKEVYCPLGISKQCADRIVKLNQKTF